jgi:hypothetical protein
MDLARDEAIWQEACEDLVGGALDRGGGRSVDAVTRSRLIAGSHVKRLHRAHCTLSLFFIQRST